MTGHYETIELVDYARGYLTGEDARKVFAHCQGCTYCGSRLAAVMALREGSRREQARAVRRRRLAMAAGIALVVTLGFAGRAYVFDGPSAIGTDSLAENDGGESLPAPELSGALAELAALAAADAGDILHPAFVDLRFGAALASTDDVEARLGAAARALWAGEIDTAVAAFEALHGERPRDPEVAAYFGIALYLHGDRRDDVAQLLHLGTTIDDRFIRAVGEYSGWFLANHYLRTGQPDRAAEELLWVSKGNERVAARATELLNVIATR